MSRKVDLFPAPVRRRNPTLKAFCVYCAALLADRGQERTLQIADLALRAKKDPIQIGRLDAQEGSEPRRGQGLALASLRAPT